MILYELKTTTISYFIMSKRLYKPSVTHNHQTFPRIHFKHSFVVRMEINIKH
jgi:hypothetical protein